MTLAELQKFVGGGLTNPRASSTPRHGLQCKGCGMQGHVISECTNRAKKCHTCGNTGHLAAACKKGQSAASAQQLCTCCGNKGHAKPECRQREQACSKCQKTGHLAKVCRSQVPLSKVAGGQAGQPSGPAKTFRQALAAEPATWKCINLNCTDAWYSDKEHKCKMCNRQRVKDPAEKKEKQDTPIFSLSKSVQEVVGRLCPVDAEEDVEMTSTEYALPLDQATLVQERAKLTQQIETMEGLDTSAEAVDIVKAQLSKLPKPSANQPHHDAARLTAQQLQLNTNFEKKIAACTKKAGELAQEQVDRAAAMIKETEEAIKQHEARLTAITSQNAIHMADAKARLEANKAYGANLVAEYEAAKELIQAALVTAAHKVVTTETTAPPVVAASRPPPPKMAQNIPDPARFSTESI